MCTRTLLIGNTFEAVLLFVLLEMIDVSVITVESLFYMQCWCNFVLCKMSLLLCSIVHCKTLFVNNVHTYTSSCYLLY